MKTLILALLVVGLSGCGKSDAPALPTKDLFSSWARQNPAGLTLDFSGMGFKANSLRALLISPSAECDCTMTFSGSQSSGQTTIAGCTFKAGSGTDPGCSSLESGYTYTKTNDTLNFCNINGAACTTWK